MPAGPFAAVVFTWLPLMALSGGILVSVWGALRLDRRLVLGVVLFGFMGVHQLMELQVLLAGSSPYEGSLEEGLETGVNLISVAVIGMLMRQLAIERRRGNRQAVIQEALFDGEIPGDTPKHGHTTRSIRNWWPRLSVVGRVLDWTYSTLPLGNTTSLSVVVETAVRNLKVSYPAANFAFDVEPGIVVFGEETTLRELIEGIGKQMIVYNDTSEPQIELTVDRRNSDVVVRITDNGPGVPEAVATALESSPNSTDQLGAELGSHRALLEAWDGSLSVEEKAVVLRLRAPGSIQG